MLGASVLGGMLLIVPYGIETCSLYRTFSLCFLLIVPYGIETKKAVRVPLSESLLIVPYGIETDAAYCVWNGYSDF